MEIILGTRYPHHCPIDGPVQSTPFILKQINIFKADLFKKTLHKYALFTKNNWVFTSDEIEFNN